MRQPAWIKAVRSPMPKGPAQPVSWRDSIAKHLALVTGVSLCMAFVLLKDTKFLMPGPLASAHGAIEKCSACHTKSGSSKVSWTHGLIAGDPRADSKACLTCHKMPDTAFNAHGAPAEVLERSTKRLTKAAAESPQPQSARAQNLAFPAHNVAEKGLTCATCHQEHQGINFKLSKISNEQCRSCHVVKFDSFDGNHPKFENYPFERRTRIVYDHAGHFGKHYPEVAKKDPAKRIPATCSTCHNTSDDKRVMTVAPFEKTCSTCHLDQISGKERVSGPKGIAFLSLPGLDLQTLKSKNALIGEWPDASDATLTPFMKVMISRNEQGRALIKSVESLNLQDLTQASDDQIKAVSALVWEIKGLFHALIAGKASDALGSLNIGNGAKLSASLVADLTASIPRDVIISAQQQWLPNLGSEIANPQEAGKAAANAAPGGGTKPPAAKETETSEDRSESAESQTASSDNPGAADEKAEDTAKREAKPCMVRILGQCMVFQGSKDNSDKKTRAAGELPGRMNAGAKDAGPAAEPEAAAAKTDAAAGEADAGKKAPAPNTKPPAKAGGQSDDLLFPTEDELRAMKDHAKSSGKAAAELDRAGSTPANAPPDSNTSAAQPPAKATPVISIVSDVDPESWAEYGGWYQQDNAIFYRPTGHKDKFIYSWLFLTGPQAPKGNASPAAAVFDSLTNKDAQGSCTKCHSIDDIPGKGRVVNFSPSTLESKQGRFTSFNHEPHFGIVGNSGCLTCHKLEKDQTAAVAAKTDSANAKPSDAEKGVSLYLKSYEQGNPQSFASSFDEMNKDLCQTCHKRSMARQDCLTCHKYHVNGVLTPILNTKLPAR